MKRILFIILCLCPLAVSAANTLVLSSVAGRPGDEVTIVADLMNTDEVSALQADIPLGSSLQYVAGSAALTARSNGHSISANASDGTLHVVIFSFTQAAIKDNAGALFTFRLKLGSEPATYNLTPALTLASSTGAGLTTEDAPAGQNELTLLSPQIEILTKSLDYGHVPIRATYSQTLRIRNTGNEPLTVQSLTFGDAVFSADVPDAPIAQGETLDIPVAFAPVTRGAVNTNLIIESNAVNGLYNDARNVSLVADPFSVNELHVGNTSGICDQTVTVAVTVNNMEPLVGAQFSFTLPAALEYVEGSAAVSERAAGLSAMGTVSGSKLTLFAYSLTNTPISGEDGELLTFQLRLNGSSGTYWLNPTDVVLSNASLENMVSATYNGYVRISTPNMQVASSVSFGSFSVTQSAEQSFQVRNTGSAPLVIDRATFLAEGFAMVTELPVEIASGGSTNLTVRHTPTVEGDFSVKMQLYSNDPNRRMQTVTLTGTVYEPNTVSIAGRMADGGSYAIDVTTQNYTALRGMQFCVRLPDGLTPQSFSLSGSMAGFTSIMQNTGGQNWLVLIYSLSSAELPAGESVIGSVLFSPSAVAAHNGEQVALTDIILTDSKGLNRFTGTDSECTIALRYTVTFVDEDGTTVLSSAEYAYGATPVAPANPSKAATERYTYTFDGWTPAIAPVTADVTYTATYAATIKSFRITFLDEDGTELESDTWDYGCLPNWTVEPTKPADAEYTYTFAAWDREVEMATADATYTATYEATPIPDSGPLRVCLGHNELHILNNPYPTPIVITQVSADEPQQMTVDYAPAPQLIVLPDEWPTGQYRVDFNGGDRAFLINKE